MKLKHLLLATIGLLLSNMSFTSCSSDDDKLIDSVVKLPKARVYILNEGVSGKNNSSISFYDPSSTTNNKVTYNDIFHIQNESALGDVGQDMIEYNNNIYVVVSGSNYITKLNSACVEQEGCRKSFVNDAILSGGIRYIAAKDNFIYASFYGGVVAKLDANTLQVVKTIKNLGNNLEGIVICDNTLYVANSYKVDDSNYIYQKEVFAIDLNNFTLKETITVDQNPNQLIEEDDKVFLISWDYTQESYVLQLIDPSHNNKVTKLGYATNMAAGDGVVYLVDSRTDYSQWPNTSTVNTFSTYDIKSGKLNNASFLKNAPEELASSSIYMMKVNPNNGDIYIGVTFYANENGCIYRFSKDGNLINKFDCGGYNPKTAIFFN